MQLPGTARGARAPRLSLLAALLYPALAGCYDTPRPACAFTCAGDGDCPGGYSCRADTWCKLDDVADDYTCGPAFPDAAAPADASLADAPLPDSSTDAAPADASAGDASAAEDATSSTLSGTTSGAPSGAAS